MDHAVDEADRGNEQEFCILIRGGTYMDDFSTRRPLSPERFVLTLRGIEDVILYFRDDVSRIDVRDFRLTVESLCIIDMRERPRSELLVVSRRAKLKLDKVGARTKIATLIKCRTEGVEFHPAESKIISNFSLNKINGYTVGPRDKVIRYNELSIKLKILGPNETFSIVFYLVTTDLQYNSQNAEVPMGPKQLGLAVWVIERFHTRQCTDS